MSSYTSYPQHAAQTITVTNTTELKAALNTLDNGGGGTILLDGNGGPFKIIGKDFGDANNPILIGALDVNNPPVVQEIYLQNASHLTMTDLHVDSSGLSSPLPYHDIRIYGSDNIELVNNHMSSNADGFLGGTTPATKGGSVALIRDSQDINFSGNYIENYTGGAGFLEVNGLKFNDNEMVGIQHDGFQAGGIQNVQINNNYMHDFFGSTQQVNHSDFIMIWGTNAKSVTANVEISGNVLDTNGGGAYQGIFIGNNQFGGSGPSGQYFQDIQIYDNLVHTSMYHGISVGDAQGVEIYDNTVLFDPESWTQGSKTSPLTQAEPWIMTSNAPSASVTGNVAGHVSIGGNGTGSGTNYILDYNNPNSAAYVENHIANLEGTDGLGLGDLQFLPTSPLYGNYGATISSTASANDPVTAVMRLDEIDGFRGAFQLNADLSLFGGQITNPSNATYEWMMDDGTYISGTGGYHIFQTPGLHDVTLKVTDGSGNVDYITRTVEVLDQTNFSINFDNGAVDTSGAGASIKVKDPSGNAFVNGVNGKGFHLDGTNNIEIQKGNEQLYDLDTFEINLDFKLDSVGSAGRLLGIHTSWDLQVLSNGGLMLNLPTDQGNHKIFTSANVLDDTAWHDITVQYDGPDGTVNILVDGAVVGSGSASGTTYSASHYGLVLGPTWGAAVKGVVDNFSMTVPPSDTLSGLTSSGTYTGGAGWTLPGSGSTGSTGGGTIDTSGGAGTGGSTGGTNTGSSGGTNTGSTGSTDTGSTGGTNTGSTGGTNTGSTGSTDTGSTGSTDTGSGGGTNTGSTGSTDTDTSGGSNTGSTGSTDTGSTDTGTSSGSTSGGEGSSGGSSGGSTSGAEGSTGVPNEGSASSGESSSGESTGGTTPGGGGAAGGPFEGSTTGEESSTGVPNEGSSSSGQGTSEEGTNGHIETDGNDAGSLTNHDGSHNDNSGEGSVLDDNESVVDEGSHSEPENQRPIHEDAADKTQIESIDGDFKSQPTNPKFDAEIAPSLNGISHREFIEKLTDWVKTKFGNAGNNSDGHESIPELSSIFHSIHAGHFGSIGKQSPGEIEEETQTDQL